MAKKVDESVRTSMPSAPPRRPPIETKASKAVKKPVVARKAPVKK